MPQFRRRTVIPGVTAQHLFDWHARPGAFHRLMPPWEGVRVVSRGRGLGVGTRVEMSTPVLGPIRARWVAVHTACDEPRGFVDEQEAGPFASWRHMHTFGDAPDGAVLEDIVDWTPPLGGLGLAVAGRMIRRRVDAMFAYRHRQTATDLTRLAPFMDRRPLTVVVSGASGLVGTALCAFLDAGGHRVRRLVRRDPGPNEVRWSVRDGTIDAAALEGVDAVVHLAGAPIAGALWTDERKALIRDSRVDGTRLLADALAGLSRKPSVFVSASAVGFYGDPGETVVDEDAPAGTGFLAEVGRAWEAAARPATDAGIRTVNLRVGIVVAANGGILSGMVPPGRLGLLGPMGSGRQGISWIALDDLVGAIHHVIWHDVRGPVNGVGPAPVSQATFVRELGRVLRRPAFVPTPGFVIRAGLGEMGDELFLGGQYVRPARLPAAGYDFAYRTAGDAMAHTLGRMP